MVQHLIYCKRVQGLPLTLIRFFKLMQKLVWEQKQKEILCQRILWKVLFNPFACYSTIQSFNHSTIINVNSFFVPGEVLQGYLSKENPNGLHKIWKRRWFVHHGKRLLYYAEAKPGAERGDGLKGNPLDKSLKKKLFFF